MAKNKAQQPSLSKEAAVAQWRELKTRLRDDKIKFEEYAEAGDTRGVSKLYTTKTGAKVLGVEQDTLKHYAHRYGIDFQPGGPGTPWLFTLDDLKDIRRRRALGEREVKIHVQKSEDREELELGPLYNADASPRL